MDCCRTARRLGGEEVRVVVRSGFEEMKASPWEKEDATHEGIPILNYLVPKAFTHEGGRLTGVLFEKVEPRYDERPPRPGADRRARRPHPVRRRPGRHRPGERLPLDRARHRHRASTAAACRWSTRSRCSRPSPGCSSAATPPSGPRTSSGPSRTATRPRSRSTCCAAARTCRDRPPPVVHLCQPEDGHPRVELRQRGLARSPLPRPPGRERAGAQQPQGRGRARLRPRARLARGAALPQLRRPDGLRAAACIECDACVDICPTDCITFTRNGPEDELRARLTRPPPTSPRTSIVSVPLKTGRVMVKDEDVCLHCGLCAERCPTGAWDMQKFLLDTAQAGQACRTR